MSPDTDLILFTRINSEWIIQLNVKCTTVNPLEDNEGENLDDLEYGDALLDITTKATYMKEILDKLDFVKIKNLCSVKDTGKRIRTQGTDFEKLCAKRHLIKTCHPKQTKHS